jgi:opacity protein-like surface antigen
MRNRPLVTLLLALGLALPAAAQELELQEPSPSPIYGFIAGGASFPISNVGDRFETGYAFTGGVGFNVHRFVGVQLDAFWSHHSVKGDVFDTTDLDANHRMQYGTLDVVFNGVRSGPLTAYVLGGGGVYYRRVELTSFVGTAVVPVCDPYLFYCFADAVPVEGVLGSRSSTDFGLNGGIGLSLRVASGLKLYLEGRYHYIFGPEFTEGGEGGRANGEYIPVMLGLRFE